MLTNSLALMHFGAGRGGGAFLLLVVLAVAVVGIMALMRPRTIQ
jgi:SNF family Na+-dependent transporter